MCAEPEPPNAASPVAAVATSTTSPAERRYLLVLSRRVACAYLTAPSALAERPSLPFICSPLI
jgi:hypothetical protein